MRFHVALITTAALAVSSIAPAFAGSPQVAPADDEVIVVKDVPSSSSAAGALGGLGAGAALGALALVAVAAAASGGSKSATTTTN